MLKPSQQPLQAVSRFVQRVAATLLFSILCSSATAQNSVEPAARFINELPITRTEWGVATIPFSEGTWMPGDRFEAVGALSHLVPFGARWPDGSVRYARMSAYLTLAPGEDRTIQVRRATGPSQLSFTESPWVASRLPGFEFELMVGRRGGESIAPFALHSVVDDTPARKTLLFRARAPHTPLIYDLWVTFFANQDHARFELRVTNSHPNRPHWRESFKYLAFRVRNAVPFVQHGDYHGISKSPPRPDGDNYVFLIDRAFELYDGQGFEWFGSFLFVDSSVATSNPLERLLSAYSANVQALFGVATNWPASGAFGPFGIVPGMPPWFVADGGRAAADAERAEFLAETATRGELFEDRLVGLRPNAAAPGDQYDFGTTQCGDIFRTALPIRIDEIRFGVGEDAMRPSHFREANGEPVVAADHPDWVTWSGRTHFDGSVSTDRLGKPYPEPWLSRNANIWNGKDNNHWSSVTVSVAYLLTTSYSIEYEINNECELFLAGRTLPSQTNAPTNGLGAARAVGRTLKTMAWHYLCTGRTDVRDRMRDRIIECVEPQYDGLMSTGPVRPMLLGRPDRRSSVQIGNWSPWGEGIGIVGLAACAEVTGSQIAKDLAEMSSKSLLWHGWRVRPNEVKIGYVMAYLPGGEALSPEQLLDPALAEYASSRDLRLWCMPSLHIALAAAQRDGDLATAERAQMIINRLVAERAPIRGGRWDRFGNWEAVRLR